MGKIKYNFNSSEFVIFIVTASTFFITVSLLVFYTYTVNNANTNLINDRNLYFENRKCVVQEIFSRTIGSKQANRCVVRECIVEDIISKERYLVYFNSSCIPLKNDIWTIKVLEVKYHFEPPRYTYILNKKYDKIR